MSQSLSLEQRQQQRLMPLQVQYVRMLEMTSGELDDALRAALDENPALTTVDPPVAEPSDTVPDTMPVDYDPEDDRPEPRLRHRASADTVSATDIPVRDTEATLAAHLMPQLAVMDLRGDDLAIARYAVASADPDGYLRRTPWQLADDLAASGILPDADGPAVESVIVHLRATLDPAGVLASDLRQCLELQLQRLPDPQRPPAALARRILHTHYDDFVMRHWPRLIAALGSTPQAVEEAVGVIRGLNPRPGARYSQGLLDDVAQTIVPDVAVEIDDHGHATVSLAAQTPSLAVADTFDLDDDAMRALPPASRAFVHTRAEEARNIMRLVSMRNDTLLRVTRALVRRQRRFFTTLDAEDIVPMGLRDIADDIGMDVSVVSRATSTKYLATPSGVFPMKMFFRQSLPSAEQKDGEDGPGATAHNIEAALRRLIDAEDPAHPLSDDALARRMGDICHLDIARRTVAKYRTRLGLPPARLRRRLITPDKP